MFILLSYLQTLANNVEEEWVTKIDEIFYGYKASLNDFQPMSRMLN